MPGIWITFHFVVGENPLDGHKTDFMAKVFDVTGDPLVSPIGIVIADFHYQSDGFLIEHPASAFLLSRSRAVVFFRIRHRSRSGARRKRTQDRMGCGGTGIGATNHAPAEDVGWVRSPKRRLDPGASNRYSAQEQRGDKRKVVR